jgi:hypothetical protein
VPDVPQTILAWRVWGLDQRGSTLTLTSTTPAGASRKERDAQREAHPLLAGLGDPISAWPRANQANPTGALIARCHAPGADEATPEWLDQHPGGIVPSEHCTGAGGHGCGIYAAKDLSVAASYLRSTRNPVIGLVELVSPIHCEQGYRGSKARVAAIMLLNEALTSVDEPLQKKVAEAYGVPALVSVSLNPEDHRELIEKWQAERDGEADLVTGIEKFLREQ